MLGKLNFGLYWSITRDTLHADALLLLRRFRLGYVMKGEGMNETVQRILTEYYTGKISKR
jgi:hypothetical protein